MTASPAGRPDASMTLLTGFMERPLDPAYAVMADRRAARGLPRATKVSGPLTGLLAVVIGLVLATAAIAHRAESAAPATAREQLVDQVRARQAGADQTAARVQQVRDEVAHRQSAALAEESAGAARELQRLELAGGGQSVSGPGLTVTLDDKVTQDSSADGDPRTGGASQGTVLSRDVQIVVNGLWAAGAEAVAVNGQRLSARSAIRFAGSAILVNYRPLTRPYTITAIGPQQTMGDAFRAGPGGAYLNSLRDNFGLRASVADSRALTLPAAPIVDLRHARASTQEESP